MDYDVTEDGPMLRGSSPEMLRSLLAEYEDLVAERTPDLSSHLNPGLPEDAVASGLGRLGLPPTPELSILYGWAGGLVSNQASPLLHALPGLSLVTLDIALERYNSDPGAGVTEGWLRVETDSFGLTVECTPDVTSRIRYSTPEFEEKPDLFRAVSVCTYTAWLIEGWQNGAYEWYPDLKQWLARRALLPKLQTEHGFG